MSEWQARPLRILVVANHPQIPPIIAGIIRDGGQPCEAHYAHDEADAIRKIPVLNPDAVVLDADIDNTSDGPSRCRKIREAFGPGQAKIIYLGWYLEDALKEGIRRLGGADAVSKPFEKSVLIQKLRESAGWRNTA